MGWNELLTLMAIDSLSKRNNEVGCTEREEDSLSITFFGISFFFVVLLFLYFLLARLGVPEDQLQLTILTFFAPFLWDYYINFTFYDVSQLQHVGAALLTILFSVLLSVLLVTFKEASQKLTSKPRLVKSFGFYLFMLCNLLEFYFRIVIVVSLFKFIVHAIISFFIWFL